MLTLKDTIFLLMKYELKGHQWLNKTTFMLKSFQHIRLWTDFDENDLKCDDMEKSSDFFTLIPSDLNTTLNYVRMDKFCPWLG